jgi:hypothetical protein
MSQRGELAIGAASSLIDAAGTARPNVHMVSPRYHGRSPLPRSTRQARSASCLFAAMKSAVSKPSVSRPYTSPSRRGARLPSCPAAPRGPPGSSPRAVPTLWPLVAARCRAPGESAPQLPEPRLGGVVAACPCCRPWPFALDADAVRRPGSAGAGRLPSTGPIRRRNTAPRWPRRTRAPRPERSVPPRIGRRSRRPRIAPRRTEGVGRRTSPVQSGSRLIGAETRGAFALLVLIDLHAVADTAYARHSRVE